MAEAMPAATAAGCATKERLKAAMAEAAADHPAIAHDLTELRRRSLLAMAAAHGDEKAAVDGMIESFVHARSDVIDFLFDDVASSISRLRQVRPRTPPVCACPPRVAACAAAACSCHLTLFVSRLLQAGLCVGAVTNGNCDVTRHLSHLFDFEVRRRRGRGDVTAT